MKNKLDSRFILSVFEKIRKHGKKDGESYSLEGLKASTDFDGYTLFIEDAKVFMQFGFHNQYHFDYSNQDDYEQFEKKLNAVASQYQ